MKLILTEQQAKKLISQLSPIADFDFEKEAPEIADVIKKIANPTGLATAASKKGIDSVKNKLGYEKKSNPLVKSSNDNEMLHPLGHKQPITSFYGIRNSKIGSPNHKGVDIAIQSGSPIYAPLDGVVKRSEDTTPNACGGHIRLKHSDMETKFCHLSKMDVKVGDKVKKGQIIGYSGGGKNDPHPGTSTGPHLHYEILINGIAQDPVSIEKNLV